MESTKAHTIGSKQGLASPRQTKSLYLCICEDAVHAHWYCHHLCCVQGPACLLCRCSRSACSNRVSKGYAGHLGYTLRDPLSASTTWHVLPGRTNTIKRSNSSSVEQAAAFEYLSSTVYSLRPGRPPVFFLTCKSCHGASQHTPQRCHTQRGPRLFHVYFTLHIMPKTTGAALLEILKWAESANNPRNEDPPDSDTARHTGI